MCIDENIGDDSSVTRVPGSPAVYMVSEFEQLSYVVAAVVAPYGDDFVEIAPETPLLGTPAAAPTLLYRNLFVDGHRLQECRHTEGADAVPLTEATTDQLADSDIVIVAPLLDTFSGDYIEQIFAATSAGALRVLVPQGYFRRVGADHRISQVEFADYAHVLPFFDLVVFSDEDCVDALARASEWSAEFAQTRIVVTQNERGATLFVGGVAHPVAATPVETADSVVTIGAGDVFSAHLALASFASATRPSATRASTARASATRASTSRESAPRASAAPASLTARDLLAAVSHANAAAGRFLETEQLRVTPEQARLSA